ncbi:glycoside hydrolase family 25 protein [Candidatus Methylobacter oryzae]|uniref:Lysozyme n=1 Tax=Candidatus Methylobacter oryzae TaxID=2497749 RepID=A0ABY3CBU7_9GAMM|nr:glycoside hydrolase family 25 protein [Candidatus Methylobacter oryzae]TRW95146.1 hypothetical protein EKO24_010525 [Candidatus Methylobacter oryzae]
MLNAVIDISHHNNISNFSEVAKSGIIGVFQKATQGFTYKDPTFNTNRKNIHDADIHFGAYHFGTAGDPIAQAEFFLSVAGDSELLVLDFESNPQGHDMSLLEAEQFVHHVFTKTGRYPGLYSGHTISEALITAGISSPEKTELSKCWLWYARYGAKPLVPKIWQDWTFWQYTDGGAGDEPHQVPGIGRCDRDYFNGSAEALRKFWTAGGA